MASYRYHQKKKKKREEFLAVAPLLLPTSNLLLPSTVYIRTKHIQYNTTLLSLCREICFLVRHLHKNIQ